MPRIRYTPEEKEKALRLCNEIGVHKASEQTGISVNSLYKWRSGVEEELPATTVEGDTVPVEEVMTEEKDVSPGQENTTPRIRYTTEQKERALRLCDEIGITKASKETGITITSLRKWRADAQNEIVTTATDETPVQEAATEEEDPHPSREEIDIAATATDASVPTDELGNEEKVSHLDNKDAGADERIGEELIRLRIENSTLKAQILALKSALRVFTE